LLIPGGVGIGENGGGQPGGGGVNRGRPKKNVKKDANLQGIVGDYNSLNKADYLPRINGIFYKEF
jgi:hypothetical protein